MINIEKQALYYSLFMFYGVLLTKKQQEYFHHYFTENWSLQEIALKKEVSRNAVYSSLKNVIGLLLDYEQKLALYKKYQLRVNIYNKYTEKYDFIKELQEIDKI